MLAGMVWFSFAVELGDKTFAQHVDHISETPEAQQLIEGIRGTLNPALDDVRDRMFGEYVEAPTHLSGEPLDATLPRASEREREREAVVPASTLRPRETDESLFEAEPARPGRRRNVYARDNPADASDDGIPSLSEAAKQPQPSTDDEAAIAEPERPGRRRRAALREPTPREPTLREPETRPRWLPSAALHDDPESETRPRRLPGATLHDERPLELPEPEPPSRLHEHVPEFLRPARPEPPAKPLALHDLPLPRVTIDDRRAATRMLELVERTRASLPPPRPPATSPSRPTIPLVQPTFDPTLPELPSE